MKILLSCLQSLRKHNIPAYEFWRSYFVEGCREAGITPLEVPDVDWAKGLGLEQGSEEIASWRSETWEKTVAFARKQHSRGGIDFFLGYLYPWQVEESAVRELQLTGIPCVNFFCDNVREFRRVPNAYDPFSLHWVPEYEALPMYRSAGLPHLHAPMPCWVPKVHRTAAVEDKAGAVFIGSADLLRRNLFSEAMRLGGDFMVYGRGWTENGDTKDLAGMERNGGVLHNQFLQLRRHGLLGLASKLFDKAWPPSEQKLPASHLGKEISADEYVRLTRESAVVLGVSRVPSALRPLRFPMKYSRLRDIEAPMLGACYLTEWTEGLEFLYEPGREIECYRSAIELAEKLSQLAAQPEHRRELRRYGQRRALAEHSVPASLRKVGKALGLNTK